MLEAESFVAEADVEGAAVEEGESLPPPRALPVIEARFGALDPILPPIVAYATGSCSAKKGLGSGLSLQQFTSTRLASQHH